MKDSSTRVTAFSKQRPRVLIVDDDEALRRIMTRMLASIGCLALSAENGGAAIRRWSEDGPFTLAIVDLSLGDMDGIELIRQLREATPETDVPFIILSGSFPPEELPPGVVAALLKPTSMTELQEAAKNAILSARSGAPAVAPPADPEQPAQRSGTRAKTPVESPKRHGAVVEESVEDTSRDRRRERS